MGFHCISSGLLPFYLLYIYVIATMFVTHDIMLKYLYSSFVVVARKLERCKELIDVKSYRIYIVLAVGVTLTAQVKKLFNDVLYFHV